MSAAAEKAHDDFHDACAGAYGTLVGVTGILGYLHGGAWAAITAVAWVLGLTLVLSAVGFVVAFHVGIRRADGDPVVVYGVLVILGAILALLLTGDWPLGLGIAVGLPLGFWYWKRPTVDVA